MVKVDDNSYLPCMKCDSWVPCYAEEIHGVECHHLGLSQFSHSCIKGSFLYAEVIIISTQDEVQCRKTRESVHSNKRKQESKKTNTSSSLSEPKKKDRKNLTESASAINITKKKFEEPEWLKKIFPSFHYQLVLMNERDMIRCNIVGYTPVILEYDSFTYAFLAIPDENTRIGHIVLHEQGILKCFPTLESTAMVVVKKLARVEVAKEIDFSIDKVLTEKEEHLAKEQLKCQLLSTCPLGSGFTLTLRSKVHLYTVDSTKQVFKVSRVVLPDKKMSEESIIDVDTTSNSIFDADSSVPSKFLTLDEYKCSESSELASEFSKLQLSDDEINGAFVTVDEYHDSNCTEASQNMNVNILTSTPNKKYSSVLHKSLLVSRTREKLLSSVACDEPEDYQSGTVSDFLGEWVRVGRDTKISIIHNRRTTSEINYRKDSKERNMHYKNNAYKVLWKIMENKLRNTKLVGNPLLHGWSGVLLHGPPGTGKTLMVEQAAVEMEVPLVTLTLSDISHSANNERVYQKFKFACENAPAILFMDEIDSLCPAGEHKSVNKNDILAAVIRGIQILQESFKPVLLIGATSNPERVAEKLQSPGRLDHQLLIPLPDSEERVFILQKLLLSHRHCLTQEDICEIAKNAYGFSGADLAVLLKCSWLNCVERHEKVQNSFLKDNQSMLQLNREDLYHGLNSVVPTMMRHNHLAISKVHWGDILGYGPLKGRLQKMIRIHLDRPTDYPLTGLLLYGPPGCSKTMFVRAIVSETNFSFFPIKCSNLLSKYVGETEKSLSKVFMQAEQAAPSIIFMDEIDSLCSDRSGGSVLVSELLSLMSDPRKVGNIWIIGATNRPAAVDEALLQPGRLEQMIHVDLPNFESRFEMWKNILAEVPMKDAVDITKLSEASAGYSGAEIIGLYQETASTAIAEMEDKRKKEYVALNKGSTLDSYITEELILKTIKLHSPRTPSSLLQTINSFHNKNELAQTSY